MYFYFYFLYLINLFLYLFARLLLDQFFYQLTLRCLLLPGMQYSTTSLIFLFLLLEIELICQITLISYIILVISCMVCGGYDTAYIFDGVIDSLSLEITVTHRLFTSFNRKISAEGHQRR